MFVCLFRNCGIVNTSRNRTKVCCLYNNNQIQSYLLSEDWSLSPTASIQTPGMWIVDTNTITRLLPEHCFLYHCRGSLSPSLVLGHRTDIRTVLFTSDGSRVKPVSISDGAAKLWSCKTRHCISTVECGTALCGIIAPGDQYVITGTKVFLIALPFILVSCPIILIIIIGNIIYILAFYTKASNRVTTILISLVHTMSQAFPDFIMLVACY